MQMELRSILDSVFPSHDLVDVGWNNFCLLISHGDCSHEALLCDLLRHDLGAHVTPSLGVSANDCHRDEASISIRYVLLALQHPIKWYQGVLDPILRQCKNDVRFKTICVADFLRQNCAQTSFGESAASDLTGPMSDSFGGRLLDYINSQVNEFLDPIQQTSCATFTIVVDNLTWLLDLGLTTRQLERLLTKWHQASSGHTRLIVGSHVGQMLDDLAASEMDPTFVHFIHLCRARASLLLELRPLTTGYSQMLDGKLSVTRRSSANRALLHGRKSLESTMTYHYHYDGSRIMCYPPGTSKLVT